MGLFVAGLVIILGVVAIISGVDGTGLSLFESVIGRTPQGAKVSTPPVGPAAPTTNPQGIPWTQVVAG